MKKSKKKLNPFKKGKKPERVDEVELDGILNQAEELADKLLKGKISPETTFWEPRLIEYVYQVRADKWPRDSTGTNPFKQLIMSSFNAGYNNFVLRLHDSNYQFFGGLQGNYRRSLILDIYGDVSHSAFKYTRYCTINLHGSLGGDGCLEGIVRCRVNIDGDASDICKEARDSIVTVKGKVFVVGARSGNCTFELYGDYIENQIGSNANKMIVRVPGFERYMKLRHYMQRNNRNVKVEQI